MTPKVPAGADLKRSETGVSEKNLRCISGTSAFRISRYQHYWRRKTTFLSLLRTFLVVERNPLLKNCGFHPLENHPFPLDSLAQTRDRRPLRNKGNGSRGTVAWLSPPFRSSQITYCYTYGQFTLCRACGEQPACVAAKYLALRRGKEMGAHCAPLR